MDPITASALVAVLTKVFDGATSEAGKEIWTALTRSVKKAFGRGSGPVEATEEVERHPGDQARIEALAESLAAEARRDPEFATDLRHWLTNARRDFNTDGDVTNMIGGSAQIGGPVVQGRDFTGDITFGNRP
jgi:hypothetical protein